MLPDNVCTDSSQSTPTLLVAVFSKVGAPSRISRLPWRASVTGSQPPGRRPVRQHWPACRLLACRSPRLLPWPLSWCVWRIWRIPRPCQASPHTCSR